MSASSSEPTKATRRRFAIAALSIATIAAACSDSPPDTDASVTDGGNTPDVHTADVISDVKSDSQQSDASDGAASDAADASDDAADASNDAADATASDAADDVDIGDAADASSDDASTIDASDASDDASDASDAGTTVEAGSKGCTGIFCMLGKTCCNNSASVNYGKCELNTCTTCCM